jgi:hypothetical protein
MEVNWRPRSKKAFTWLPGRWHHPTIAAAVEHERATFAEVDLQQPVHPKRMSLTADGDLMELRSHGTLPFSPTLFSVEAQSKQTLRLVDAIRKNGQFQGFFRRRRQEQW